MKKIISVALTTVLVGSLSFGTAFASFTDVDDSQKVAIDLLKDRGIVSGIDKLHFAPKGKITYAQSVQMIVKGLDFNLDTMRFIKQPLASDTYTNVSNDSWYANAFVIAKYSGLEIPADVNPNAVITREQFGDLLVRALEKKGSFPTVKMFIQFNDEAQITPDLQGSLQRMVLYKIAELDKKGNFEPKGEVTRGQAATWVYNTVRFLETHEAAPAPTPAPTEQVTVKIDKISDDVNKVTLSRGEKPNAGYGIVINSIRFAQDGHAVVTYSMVEPDPDKMYAEMLTEAKAETYISSKYTVTSEPSFEGIKGQVTTESLPEANR
ncbi:protease complex subunit PrcB family protein [Paenibacillus psychroresistens]|uniref:Protease complex subunit PrcB family protein n=1 Tax=Paenibacillus psychroresistens TaxID=1778678 RepID=A0A6B8RVB9_9BACL|nr:S-layer homology domain-containing protein [Paenibacillus psychroresistens]QGQ99575.1 protease complex subunit PrcB family protein [Paenibacillus psychroresistens]